MTAEDMRLRFIGRVKDTGAAFIKRFTDFDRAHAMAFIATHIDTRDAQGGPPTRRAGARMGRVRPVESLITKL